MQIGTGLPVPLPLLQIFAGGQALAVVDPALDVYIGTHPPASFERMAVVRFSHPHPIGVRLSQHRLDLQGGFWFVNSDPGPVTLVGGGYKRPVPARDDGPADLENAGPMPFCLLAPGLSRLIFGESEEVLLWVPGQNLNLLSAGSLIDVVSDHERGLRRARQESERWTREEKWREAISPPQVPSSLSAGEMEREAALRQKLDCVTRDLSDLNRALASEAAGEVWNLLSLAAQMTRRRWGVLEYEMATLKQHVLNLQDSVAAGLDKLQNLPPPLTADQYAWALAYARSRAKGG